MTRHKSDLPQLSGDLFLLMQRYVQRSLLLVMILAVLLGTGQPVDAGLAASTQPAAVTTASERLAPEPAGEGSLTFLPLVKMSRQVLSVPFYSSFPYVDKHLAYTAEGVQALFTLQNNIGRPLERFALSYTVRSADPSLAAITQSSSQSAFTARSAAIPSGIVFSFELAPGQSWAADAEVILSAHFRLAEGARFSDQIEIEPRSFSYADANYNQINDALEGQMSLHLRTGSSRLADEPLPVIVALDHPVTDADRQAFSDAGGTVESVFEGEGFASFAGSIPAAGIKVYVAAAGDGLVFLDPDAETTMTMDVATANTRVANVWTGALAGNNRADPDLAYQGDNQTAIAFIDTGIDDAHPALRAYQDVSGVGWGGLAVGTKIVGWRDFNQPASATPVDTDGHGSHVAGILAGAVNGANPTGVARSARLVAMRATGGVSRSIAALRWLRANRVAYRIVALSSSQGVAGKNIPDWDEEMRLTFQDGTPIAQAAGNDFDNFANLGLAISTPGVSPYVITVGAVDDQDRISYFSSQGHPQFAAFGLVKPDVVAPGGTYTGIRRALRNVGAVGAHLVGTGLGADLLPNGNAINSVDSNDRTIQVPAADLAPNANDYIEMAGTSMAAPHVGGELGLLVDAITEYGSADADGQGGADEDPWNGVDDDVPQDDIIDEDFGQWNQRAAAQQARADRESNARLLKSVVLMTTFELTAGETVPRWAVGPRLDIINDINGNGQRDAGEATLSQYFLSAVAGDVVWDVNGNGVYNRGTDVLWNSGGGWAPGTANNEALNPISSPAAGPFTPVFPNAGTVNSPPAISRGGKDTVEGYGRIAVDAAIEAVTREFCAVETDSFGAGLADKKIWARHLHLYAGKEYKALVEMPAGGDFDLYLYYGNVQPDQVRHQRDALLWSRGEPVTLAKSVNAGNGADEEITFEVPQDGLYFLVVRRVSGNGQFTIRLITPEEWTIMAYMPAEQQGGDDLDDRLFEALNDMEATGSGEESMKDFQVLALVDYDQRAYDGQDGPPPANEPDHRGDAVVYCVRKDHKDGENQFSIVKQPTDVLMLTNIGQPTQRSDANMGDPETLKKFAGWAVDYFPARRYALILWGDGRGYGWKVNPAKALGPGNDNKRRPGDAADANKDALEMKELRQAVGMVKGEINQGSQYKNNTGVDKKIDLLGFDMGHMALVEIGRQVQNSVEVMVASEERIHDKGWPYKEVLAGLKCERDGAGWKNCKAAEWDAEDFGKHIVSVYHTYYMTDTVDAKHTLSAVRLSPKPNRDARQQAPPARDRSAGAPTADATFDQLVTMVSSFGAELRTGVEDYQAEDSPTDNVQIKIKHEGREGSDEMEDKNYIDLRHFAQRVRDSSVPQAYKTQSDPIYQALKKEGGIVLASEHGPGHPNAHGLTIYFPHDQLLPKDANCKDAPDPGDRTCGFDGPLPSKVLYAKDAAILASVLRQPANSDTHPRPQIEGFRFPQETIWDEFLHRYYKPVADACVRWVGGCFKHVLIPVGATVTLSGHGSSDSDGPAQDDLPQDYYWDLDLTKDVPAPDPVYPMTSTVPIDPTCSDDCDRDSPSPKDETDDDPNARGVAVDWTCPRPGTFAFRLMVHDEHNDQNRVYGEETHYVHWKLDTDSPSVTCFKIPWIPIKTPDPTTTPPHETVVYTLQLINSGAEAQMLTGIDALPDGLIAQPSSVACSVGACGYDATTDAVHWEVTLAPESEATLDYSVVTEVPPECPPPPEEPPVEPPPEIINRFRVTDAAGNTQETTSSLQVLCPQPDRADLGLAKTAFPDPVVSGAQLVYDLAVTNNGPDAATNVVLSDTLPTGVTLLNTTVSQGGCSGSETITCQLGNMAAGATASTVLQVLVLPSLPDGTMLTNRASVTADTADPDSTNNETTVQTMVSQEVQNADLTLTKEDAGFDPAKPGGSLNYQLVICNQGPSAVANFGWQDDFPSGLIFQGIESAATVQCEGMQPGQPGPGQLGCFVPAPLEPDACATIQLLTQVDPQTQPGSQIQNCAEAGSEMLDPNPDNNQACQVTQIGSGE